jgi:hypothetical protein
MFGRIICKRGKSFPILIRIERKWLQLKVVPRGQVNGGVKGVIFPKIIKSFLRTIPRTFGGSGHDRYR